MFEAARRWAETVKRDVVALYLAGRDARTPWLAKAVAVAVVAYALSPIDLIPDFIPVIGYLDDVLLVPLGILLAVSLIPAELMAEFRTAASERAKLPANRTAAICIVAVWAAMGVAAIAWLLWFLWS
jgi:uncharacterized membrane protein YkvA (DUF1232 family)